MSDAQTNRAVQAWAHRKGLTLPTTAPVRKPAPVSKATRPAVKSSESDAIRAARALCSSLGVDCYQVRTRKLLACLALTLGRIAERAPQVASSFKGVRVIEREHLANAFAQLTGKTIEINGPRSLGELSLSEIEFLFAHEFAHHLLSHAGKGQRDEHEREADSLAMRWGFRPGRLASSESEGGEMSTKGLEREYTLEPNATTLQRARRLNLPVKTVRAWRTLEDGSLREFRGSAPNPISDAKIRSVEDLLNYGATIRVSVYDTRKW